MFWFLFYNRHAFLCNSLCLGHLTISTALTQRIYTSTPSFFFTISFSHPYLLYLLEVSTLCVCISILD